MWGTETIEMMKKFTYIYPRCLSLLVLKLCYGLRSQDPVSWNREASAEGNWSCSTLKYILGLEVLIGVLISWSIFPEVRKVTSTFWSFFNPGGKRLSVLRVSSTSLKVFMYVIYSTLYDSMMLPLAWVWSCHIIHRWGNYT